MSSQSWETKVQAANSIATIADTAGNITYCNYIYN